MKGKICIITGANSGLGKATALELAKRGATVIMACRDQQRGEAACTEFRTATGNSTVEMLRLDLGARESVRQAAQEFKQRHNRLDVLVNNAAVYKAERTVTVDGLETTFATNHLGHFLLTTLLLDTLKASAPSRIIHISAPTTTHLDFDDLQGERKFSAFNAFGASKMCNLLFGFDLARRLQGTGVTSNVLHPGLMKSNLMGEAPRILQIMLNLVSAKPEKAAQSVVYLAEAPELVNVSGKFFKGKKIADPDPYAKDPQVQQRLWEISEQLTHSA